MKSKENRYDIENVTFSLNDYLILYRCVSAIYSIIDEQIQEKLMNFFYSD
jgi:hypothetical protein